MSTVLAQTSACSRRRCRLRLCQPHKSSNYHGNVNVGMLLSAIHAEGPIWKGHTSFNIAARASYFNWIMQPLLDKVYDNTNALKPYSKMNYYDLNAKFVHKFSDRDKLTAVVYWGKEGQ